MHIMRTGLGAVSVWDIVHPSDCFVKFQHKASHSKHCKMEDAVLHTDPTPPPEH